MSIYFETILEGKYFISKFRGTITDQDMFSAYVNYFNSDEWHHGFNEFADLSEADITQVTSDGLRKIINLVKQIFRKNNVNNHLAIYAPEALSYGMSRMYDALSYDNPVCTKIFSDKKAAIDWLSQNQPDDIPDLQSCTPAK